MNDKAVFGFDVDTSKLTQAASRLDKIYDSLKNIEKTPLSKVGAETFSKSLRKASKSLMGVDVDINKLKAKASDFGKAMYISFAAIIIPTKKFYDTLRKSVDKLKEMAGSMRLIKTYAAIQIARGLWDKMTNFSDNANANKRDARAMNSSVKNIRAIDFAFDRWGSSFDRSHASEVQNSLSDTSKWGAFGSLGINVDKINQLKKLDGADAFMRVVEDVIKRVNEFGGFDNETSKNALSEHINSLGLNWEELKAINDIGFNKINNTYEERKRTDPRNYTAFEAFERTKKDFVQTLDDVWEGLVSKFLPAVNALSEAITKVYKSFSQYLSRSDAINKLSKSLEKWGQTFADKIKKIDFEALFKSVADFIVDIPNKIKAFWEAIKSFISVLADIVSVFDREKGDKLKESVDSTYSVKKMEKANEKINEKGWFGSDSTIENLNKFANMKASTSNDERVRKANLTKYANNVVRELGSPVNKQYGSIFSKEFTEARNSLLEALNSTQIKQAKDENKEIDIVVRWEGNEAVLTARDKNTNNVLLRQAVMKKQN